MYSRLGVTRVRVGRHQSPTRRGGKGPSRQVHVAGVRVINVENFPARL